MLKIYKLRWPRMRVFGAMHLKVQKKLLEYYLTILPQIRPSLLNSLANLCLVCLDADIYDNFSSI